MNISELFFSIQGEGKRTGVPSFFIRTNKCNLRCMFASGNLCDTPYTSWTPEDEQNIGELRIDDIINEYKSSGAKEAVITGGEPTLQHEELYDLCSKLKDEGAYITLETNGTIEGRFLEYIDLISVSPKLKSSTPYDTKYEKMHLQNRINLDVLKIFHEHTIKENKSIQWKFVYCNEKDIDEILLLQKKVGFANSDIYLMPEGITEKDISVKRKELAEVCKKYHFNYTERLHILIWGSKRGV